MFKRLTLSLVFIQSICGSNILFVSDVPSTSHQIWNYEIVDGLLEKGHNVTMFGASPLKGQDHKNYHIIDIEGMDESAKSEFNLIDYTGIGVYKNLDLLYDYGFYMCNYTLKTQALQILLNYPKDFKFDLLIMDITCGNCLLPLIQRFNYAPTVAVTAFLLPPYLSDIFGNQIQPAYLPIYPYRFDGKPTFFQRLVNYFWLRFDTVARKYYLAPTLEARAKEFFGDDIDSLESLEKHISLLFCNIIQGYHYAQPLTPNIIPIGGVHINPTKKLPEDLQKIMDNSKNGVILFSLGTNIKSYQLDEYKKNSILDALGQLKQTVLWKYEKELDKVPKNVIIRKFLPQREILAHPNIRAFISHGGALSTIEASYFGVPVIGIPFIGDQPTNIQLLVDIKQGIYVDVSVMTTASLLHDIKEILDNPIYFENAKRMSKIIQDQPETPLDRAIFWMEYAIRHNGTHFLDPSSRYLPLFVSSCMDIYLFVLFISVSLAVIIFKLLTFIYSKLSTKHSNKKIKVN